MVASGLDLGWDVRVVVSVSGKLLILEKHAWIVRCYKTRCLICQQIVALPLDSVFSRLSVVGTRFRCRILRDKLLFHMWRHWSLNRALTVVTSSTILIDSLS